MAWCLGQCAKHDPHSWVNTGEERRAAQHTRRFSLCLPNLCPVQQCLCALCSFMLECKHENPNKDQNIVSGAHVIITGSLTFVCFGFFTHTMCVLLKKKKKISIMTGLCLLSGFDGGDVSKVASLQQATETPFISLG